MKTTIKQLRQQGYKVRVLHFRHLATNYNIKITSSKDIKTSYTTKLSKGGSTTIELTTPDKSRTVIGKSVCSLGESFNRKLGNNIALGRALKQLKLG